MTNLAQRPRAAGAFLRRLPKVLLRVGVVAVAVIAPPALAFGVAAPRDLNSLYAPAADTAVPASARDVRPPAHDPAKPTAVVLVSTAGANAGDALNPYETLAATGAFNLYTVAPDRLRVPLLGGLDLVPDLSFTDLDRRLAGRAADLVVVPQVPDGGAAVTARLEAWLRGQSEGGALLLGVCRGSELLASAGVLDGRDATSHWLRIGKLTEQYPQIRWHRATRYVDDGDVITTGGVLSGIDGTLRVIERRLGTQAAAAAAAAVGWEHYSPGRPAPLPDSRFGPRDLIAGVNLAFRPNQHLGVVLTEGVGEIDLASVFTSYTEAAYAARTVAVGAASVAPVRSRHGLVFVPRESASSVSGIDRLLVPGAGAASRRDGPMTARLRAATGLEPEYVHTGPGFAFDAVLRDLARSVDVPTARWRAKALEYPAGELTLAGPRWPWGYTALPLLYSMIGLAAAISGRLWWRAWRARRAVPPAAAPAPAGPGPDAEPSGRRVQSAEH
jgi:putative intracellular protease/amidase